MNHLEISDAAKTDKKTKNTVTIVLNYSISLSVIKLLVSKWLTGIL